MAATDRLSGLSDDLLDIVISSLPTRDAACTAALSGRWRPLWPRTDTINLDTRCYGGAIPASSVQDRLLRHARAALGFTGRCPVRKLSLFVTGPSTTYCHDVMGGGWMPSLLAAPALRHLEELRIVIEVNKRGVTSSELNKEERRVYINLDPAILPAHTLRVLDLTCCRLQSPPAAGAAAFPRLSALRLCKCSLPTEDLEDMIGAAPSLGSLHIESHDHGLTFRDGPSYRFSLRCPRLTTLTLVDDASQSSPKLQRIELDAPCLRALRYDGHLVEFSMRSPATQLTRADLALGPTYVPNRGMLNLWSAPLCQILRRLVHAKALRLKVPSIEGVAEALQHEHLQVTLLRLGRLELEGPFESWGREGKTAAMATLLHCCPVIHDLRIRITPLPSAKTNREVSVPDFDVSMDLFQRRDSEETLPRMRASELPGLSGCRFSCLENNHLKNVKLEFELSKLDSFEVCLARFFAENCLALEVLEIDDGKNNFLNHIDWMVERWRANALERKHIA